MARGLAKTTAVLMLLGLLAAAPAAATDVGALQAKVDSARSQARGLAADLRAKQSQMAAAQAQAAAATAREEQLSTMLATGREHAARLALKVRRTRRALALERRRLRRARHQLAQRLVAIYESGDPDVADAVLGSASYSALVTSAHYLRQIEDSDSALAARVEQVRNAVRHALAAVRDLKARIDAYNRRLDGAREQIAGVRAEAEASAARLHGIAAAREASLATLKANIGSWVDDIRAAQAAAARQASASAAEDEVEKWLGGPYSIPADIVMCESGGNYGAVNPSSGAGGAYQILPSTWHLYGGKGSPQDGSKAEQDSIAAQIWADSGSGAWVCGG